MMRGCTNRKVHAVGLPDQLLFDHYPFVLSIVAAALLFAAGCAPIIETEVTASVVEADSSAAAGDGPEEEKTAASAYPIEVTYFTPSQTEGPFYPVSKPGDRDNDLVAFQGASGPPAGEVLEFGGALYDGSGMPVRGAVIEIWQTDDNGIYLHPGDSDFARRDANFQSYGESFTAEDGSFSFRTIMPGGYAPRPRHIHVKVRLDGRELLTTQFYFDNDPDLAKDRIFAGSADEQSAMIMAVEEGLDVNGNSILVGKRDIILRGE